MYDRGMDAEKQDMVITTTARANLDETLAFLQRIAPTVVEPSCERGTAWRIPRCPGRGGDQSSTGQPGGALP
jgi:hypothetical protein